MKSEIILQEKYRDYEILVRKIWREDLGVLFSALNNEWYCVYVVIPKGHKYYDVDYEDVEEEIDVHGGLTFSGELDGIDGYLLGFDCNHSFDNPVDQDASYTLSECKRMVDQLIEAENE